MKKGIILTNTGTPDAPTPKAVRAYLREFLSDPRVIQLPRIVWLPILYTFVLNLRPARSARLYEKIWLAEGAPMRVIMTRTAEKLAKKVQLPTTIGMHYGQPSIKQAIQTLKDQGVDDWYFLPLYPQYSDTTTASSLDRIKAAFTHLSPETYFFNKTYASHPPYIHALKDRVKHFWRQRDQQSHLIISFHGIPKRYVQKGDPYASECEQTAQLLAQALDLSPQQWTMAYQSKFGYDKWLQPSVCSVLKDLAKQRVRQVDVFCPGFPVDCLETLEEIAIRAKETFIEAGGHSLHYIPALNDSDAQVDLLASLVNKWSST